MELVLGIASGFVVIGKIGTEHIIGLYDIHARRCKAHRLEDVVVPIREWSLHPESRLLGGPQSARPVFALDLSADPVSWRFPPLRLTDAVSSCAEQRAFHHAKTTFQTISSRSRACFPFRQGVALRLHEIQRSTRYSG